MNYDSESEKKAYEQLDQILERAKKVNMPGKGWQLIKMVQTQIDILKELGLIPKAPASDTQLPKRKRGRPRKNPAIV